MRASASKHLLFHLLFKLFTPVSHSYITSPYQTRPRFWKSSCSTTATSSDSKNIQETIGAEYTGDKDTISDSGNIWTTRLYTVNETATLFSHQDDDTSLYTINTNTESSHGYSATVMQNKGNYERTTVSQSQTNGDFKQEVTTRNTTEWSTDQLYEMDSCAQYSTCNYVSTVAQFCQCDQLCSIYNDCCVDVYLQNKSASKFDSIECTSYSSHNSRHGIFAITRCPDSIHETDEISQKCQITDLLTVGPLVLDDGGFVYRNRFCAECHNKTRLHMFSVVISNVPSAFLDFRVNETLFSKLQELLLLTKNVENNRSVLEQVPPSGFNVRHCIQFKPGPVTACPDLYTSPVMANNVIYRNQFCIPTETKQFRCLGYKFHMRDLYTDFLLHGVFPLSVMFSFSSTDVECTSQVNGVCFDQEIYQSYETTTEYLLTSNVMLSELRQRQLLLVFLWTFPSDIMIKQVKVGPTKMYNSSVHMEFSVKLAIIKEMQGKQMLAYKTMMENLKCHIVVHKTGADSIRIRIKKTKIKYGVVVKLFNARFILHSEIRRANVNISVTKKDVVCIQNSIEVEYYGNTSLELQKIKCMEEYFNRTPKKLDDKMKTILTYSGMSISVFALIVSLIIHRRFGMHKSIPGSNAENLSVSLLFSNVLFLFGVGANDYRNVCYIIGVSLHYLWLSVFSFMSITIINMFHDLRRMTLNTAVAQKSKTKTALTIVGLLLPTIFVVPSVILDYLEVIGFKSRYDGIICFPTGYPAAVIFVSCPIGLSILVNLICFFGIAAVLTKHSIIYRHIRKSSSYQNVSVYARISVVTGLFWTTGIMGIIMPTETVEYVFIICCSLQGFFVSLCNLTTKRVIRQVKEYFAD